MKTIKTLFFLMLFAVLFASTRTACSIERSSREAVRAASEPPATGTPIAPPAEPSADEIAWGRYRAAVDAAGKAHLARLDAMYGDFLRGLYEKGPSRFVAVRNSVPAVKRSVSGFKTAGKMVKDIALDTAKGGDRFERRIEGLLEVPFVRPLSRAREGVFADCETFASKLAAEARAYREEIGRAQAVLPEKLRLRVNDAGFQALVERDKAAMRKLGRKAVENAACVAFEAAFAKSTYAAARELVMILGGKAVAKGGLTIALPFVDGPIPVGDILAVGGAAWTAWDVHKLARVLPDAIENQLRATVDQTQRDTLAEAARFAREAHDACAVSAVELGRAAVK